MIAHSLHAFLESGREHQVYLGAGDDVLRKISRALQGGRCHHSNQDRQL